MEVSYYEGAHAIKIGTKHSWTDWHLIPTSKPVISPPQVKTKTVDIPGANGVLDLTSILTGFPFYSNRTGSLEFLLAPGYMSWENTKSEIMNYLQGYTKELYLVDDPGFYYTGRFWVNDLKSDQKTNTITINYDLYPFKRAVLTSDQDYLWDDFNFEVGEYHDYSDLEVDGTLEIVIDDCLEQDYPTITVSANMTMTHSYTRNGTAVTNTYSLTEGANTPGFRLIPGTNTLTFTGDGTVTVSYRRGIL